jgi:site-specific recombinase XerD
MLMSFLRSKADNGWNRESVSTAAQALRSFFRHAERRGWCKPGIAAGIQGPKIYQYAGLPEGPTWDIRHTTATHLLRAGVDINTIRAWLGHVSIETTNVYAEIDLEMKAKALKMCEANGKQKRWRDNTDLLAFLARL